MPSPWRDTYYGGKKLRLTDEQIRRYRNGETITALAAECGVSRIILRNSLRWAGIYVPTTRHANRTAGRTESIGGHRND